MGKTLFAKNLAKETGMNFMYLTVSDLSQLKEEEALRTLKEFFAYASAWGPCVLIVDEADRLFAANDIKAKKLALLFQREFSKAAHTTIQLVFITNFPGQFPAPILNRISKKVCFDKPTFETQIELFELHIKLAMGVSDEDLQIQNLEARIAEAKAKDMSFTQAKYESIKHTKQLIKFINSKLKKSMIKGLVGRDIEAICLGVRRRKNPSPEVLVRLIKGFFEDKKAMEKFAQTEAKK